VRSKRIDAQYHPPAFAAAEGWLRLFRIVAGIQRTNTETVFDLSRTTAVFLTATFLFAGMVKGVTGMGLPTVAMGLLGTAMPPVDAAALLLVPSFAANVWQLFSRAKLAPIVARLWTMMGGIVVGTMLGTWFLTNGRTRFTTTALGIALIVYAGSSLLSWSASTPPALEHRLSPVVGLMTGVLTGATGVFTIPAVPFLHSLDLGKDEFVQALGLSFTVSTIALAFGLARGGTLHSHAVMTSALATIPALAGVWAGQHVRRRISPSTFRRYFLLLLLVLGFELVASSRVLAVEAEELRRVFDAVFQIGQQPLVGEIERTGMPPVVPRRLVQPIHDLRVADVDGELPPAVQAAGGEVDRSDQRRHAVGQHHLAVELQVLQLVDLDAEIVQDAQSADAFDELVALEGMRRPPHDVDFHAPPRRPHEPLDDDGILKALVLDKQPMSRFVDEPADAVAAGAGAPHEAALCRRLERLPVPVGLEALDRLGHFAPMVRHDGVIARRGQVLGGPVERLDERGALVDHHRLLVREVERGAGVLHGDVRSLERPAGGGVVLPAAAARRVEHGAHGDASPPGRDDRPEQRRMREGERLDTKRTSGAVDRVHDRLHRVVWQDD
jgi:hypothetical protein